MRKRLTRRDGMSLVELLVAIAIGGVTSLAIVQLTSHVFDFKKSNELQMTTEEIRRFLVEAVSCDETLRPSGTLVTQCTGSGTLDVKDRAGETIVSKNGTRFSNFLVRATCPEANGERQLYLEQLYVKPNNNDPALNPLTKEVSTWTSLFKVGLTPCAASSAPEEMVVHTNLEMDFATLLTVTAFLLGAEPDVVVACADSEWSGDNWRYETSLLYHGFAQCPRGYTIVGGGVDCSGTGSGDPAKDWVPALNSGGLPFPYSPLMISDSPFGLDRRVSYKIFNDPIYDDVVLNEFYLPERKINAWHGGCCMRVNTFPVSGIEVPIFPGLNSRRDRVFARCRRNFAG